ncbi:MAG: hypothetical protein IKR27_08130 [Lachnospiraceae bacterium]|nr:hypothetical protein [Lachnospiraceae bacterium]
MKKSIVAIISIAVSLLIVIGVIIYKNPIDNEEKEAEHSSQSTSESESKTDVNEELEKVKLLGFQNAGHYYYKEKLLLGEIERLDKRITLSDARKIVADYTDEKDIINAFKNLQPTPDFAGGSGISRYEYWLDDSGNEMIVVFVEQFEVWYINTQNNTSEKLK